MSDSLDLFLEIFGLIAICYLVYIYYSLFSVKAIVKKSLFNKESIKISNFISGESEKIKGTVICFDRELVAPISGRKCVYYRVLVKERNNRGGSYYKIIDDEKFDNAIILTDNKDFAVIETEGIRSHLFFNNKLEFVSNNGNPKTATMEKFMADHGESRENTITNYLLYTNDFQYKEWIIEEGDTLVAFGKGEWQKKYDAIPNIPKQKILVINTNTNKLVYVSNDVLFFDKIN